MVFVIGIVIGILLFFGGLYQTSRSTKWLATFWAILSIGALMMVGSSIITLIIPNFWG